MPDITDENPPGTNFPAVNYIPKTKSHHKKRFSGKILPIIAKPAGNVEGTTRIILKTTPGKIRK